METDQNVPCSIAYTSPVPLIVQPDASLSALLRGVPGLVRIPSLTVLSAADVIVVYRL